MTPLEHALVLARRIAEWCRGGVYCFSPPELTEMTRLIRDYVREANVHNAQLSAHVNHLYRCFQTVACSFAQIRYDVEEVVTLLEDETL